jgi:hypothetical protein
MAKGCFYNNEWNGGMMRQRDFRENELLLIAEAVADAAICCRYAKGKPTVTPELRDILIDEVKRNPEFTAQLFRDGVCTLQ